jgi:hypothetical protein
MFFGGSPLRLTELNHYDGMLRYDWYWCLTTGAGWHEVRGNIIRASGIYDEPGRLSYFTCLLCYLRIFAKKSEKVTFILMLLGNISFSMMHIICFALYIVHLFIKYNMKKMFILYAVVALAIMGMAYFSMKDYYNEILFMRFALNETGDGLAGDSRGKLFENAKELIKKDKHLVIFGLSRDDKGMMYERKRYLALGFSGFGENPLTPILVFGMFIAWIYYFWLAFFVMCAFVDKKHFFIYFSFFLILLQRPYMDLDTVPILLMWFASWDTVKIQLQKIRQRGCVKQRIAVPYKPDYCSSA